MDNLEANAGDIAYGMAATTGTRNQDFVILIDEIQAAIAGHESRNLLPVSIKLHTATHLRMAG